LQLLSLTKGFLIKNPIIYDGNHNKNVRMKNIPKVVDPKVNWDDNIHKLIYNNGHLKTYHSDIKCHIILNTILGVVTLDILSTLCNVESM
jgi:hypothetical protein